MYELMRIATNWLPPFRVPASSLCSRHMEKADSMELSTLWAMLGLDFGRLLPHIVALLVAYLLAIPLGWDREQSENSAGLRTFPLVAVAACGFIQATERLLVNEPEALARVVEGIIGGIGFIGGGAILKDSRSVRGTATAASLWATGAVGVAVGLGSTDVAIVISIFTFATLRFLAPLKEGLGSGSS